MAFEMTYLLALAQCKFKLRSNTKHFLLADKEYEFFLPYFRPGSKIGSFTYNSNKKIGRISGFLIYKWKQNQKLLFFLTKYKNLFSFATFPFCTVLDQKLYQCFCLNVKYATKNWLFDLNDKSSNLPQYLTTENAESHQFMYN